MFDNIINYLERRKQEKEKYSIKNAINELELIHYHQQKILEKLDLVSVNIDNVKEHLSEKEDAKSSEVLNSLNEIKEVLKTLVPKHKKH